MKLLIFNRHCPYFSVGSGSIISYNIIEGVKSKILDVGLAATGTMAPTGVHHKGSPRN